MKAEIKSSLDKKNDKYIHEIKIEVSLADILNAKLDSSEKDFAKKLSENDSISDKVFGIIYPLACVEFHQGKKLTSGIKRSIYATAELGRFAKMMNAELVANIDKGDWKEFTDEDKILLGLEEHRVKLIQELALEKVEMDNKRYNRIKELIADCGNYLLMLANAKGYL